MFKSFPQPGAVQLLRKMGVQSLLQERKTRRKSKEVCYLQDLLGKNEAQKRVQESLEKTFSKAYSIPGTLQECL